MASQKSKLVQSQQELRQVLDQDSRPNENTEEFKILKDQYAVAQ